MIGAIILGTVLKERKATYYAEQDQKLIQSHEESLIRFKTGVKLYSMFVSSLKAYFDNSSDFPSEKQLKAFVSDITSEVGFEDSVVVSWVDTNQVFKYVVTPHQIDPFQLKGQNVNDLRPTEEVEYLNKFMSTNEIQLFDPINLNEGWVGFPFNFAVRNGSGENLGYVAPILDVKFLLDYTRNVDGKSEFVNRFRLKNNVDLSRAAVYDGTNIYNKNKDPEHYKNFKVSNDEFLESTVDLYGLKIIIGSAYKERKSYNDFIRWLLPVWYTILIVLCVLFVLQFLRNRKLTFKLASAHSEIKSQNIALQNNIESIKMLMKEVHHRVKNNLQIMTSLMNLQKNTSDNEEVRAALNSTQVRIQSMAIVHNKLYASENLSSVDLRLYLTEFIDSVSGSLGDEHEIEYITEISDGIYMDLDKVIPIGLILNELITNSYKYAFNSKGDRSISISLDRIGDNVLFQYSDSGPGIPESIKPESSDSLGLELIYMLVDQISGTISYERVPNHCFKIIVPLDS